MTPKIRVTRRTQEEMELNLTLDQAKIRRQLKQQDPYEKRVRNIERNQEELSLGLTKDEALRKRLLKKALEQKVK